MKKTTIILVIIGIIIVLVGAYFLMQRPSVTPNETENTNDNAQQEEQTNEIQKPADESETVIGTSIENRNIVAYHYGTGSNGILFVGGVHGGYEWNTTLVAYKLMDYLEANPDAVPENVKVTVIPVLNPDGLNKVVGTTTNFLPTAVSSSNEVLVSGRFNVNGVDLNRNFDCDWQANGVWQDKTVSGGSKAFSEPESQAFKKYIETYKPDAVVVWFSAAGGVFSSECHSGILSETRTINGIYSSASGYKSYDSFDFYETTGDMTNWLAKINIPAISILLTNHEDIEWSKNQAGIVALLNHYAQQ